MAQKRSMRALSEGLAIALEYGGHLVGTPYIYGGESIHSGMDCSGLIRRVFLAAHPYWPRQDMTAEGIRDYLVSQGYRPIPPNERRSGMLCFYGAHARVSHVSMVYKGAQHILEAGGGNSSTQTTADAERQGAFVRVRPFDYRLDLITMLDPWD